MSWLDGLLHRVRAAIRPARHANELDEEIRHHLELDVMQQGDAWRARRRFGNRPFYAEETRNMSWLGTLDVVQQDLRFAWRSIIRDAGVTGLVVLTFTLGIGVNAATFAVLDRMYLRQPAGVADPGSVYRVWWVDHAAKGGTFIASTYPVMSAVRAGHTAPDLVALYDNGYGVRLGGTRADPLLRAQFPTHNFFSVLGVRPQLGRFFGADEDRVGSGAAVAVLSDHTWRTHFAADSSVVGREIRLDAGTYTVVGVAASGFAGIELEPTDVWIPMASMPDQRTLQGQYVHMYFGTWALVRSPPGPSLAEFERHATQTQLAVLRASGTAVRRDSTVAVAGPIVLARGPGSAQQSHLIATRLSAVALIVLLIASANVINMLLARATRRRREIAVRLALGVSRLRLVRMLTIETLVLAVLGAGAALLAAVWGGAALRAMLLPGVQFVDAAIDARVVVFTIGLALLSGAAAGLFPALQSSKPDLSRALKAGARDGAPHSRTRAALVVAQAAFSVVLLVGAALFVRSLANVRGVDLGFDDKQIIIATVAFNDGQAPPGPEISARVKAIAERMAKAPGVLATDQAISVPMAGRSFSDFWIESDSSDSLDPTPAMLVVSDRYFATTGIRFLRGTVFENRAGSAPQAVVNKTFASLAWPGMEPIGQCIRIESATSPCYAVSGVVEASRSRSVVESDMPQYYLPMANMPGAYTSRRPATVLLVRAVPDAAQHIVTLVASELKREFPDGYPNARLMPTSLEWQYRPWQVGAWLFSAFGTLALIVAVLGIYGAVSYNASQRTHEFGVRVALGARVADVLWQVIADGVRTVAVGVALGIVLALAAGKLVSALLYGVSSRAPDVMAAASFALLLASAIAACGPAWRASRVDPATALRGE